jgi:hypothetical protein
MIKQLTETPMLPSMKAPEYGIPLEADEMIMRMLEKEREKRYQSMDDIVQVLSNDRSIEDPSRGREALPEDVKEDMAGKVERVLSQTKTQRIRSGGGKRALVGFLSFCAVAGAGGIYAHQAGYFERAPSLIEQVRKEVESASSVKDDAQVAQRESFSLTLRTSVKGAEVYLSRIDGTGKSGPETLLGLTDEKGDFTAMIDRGLVRISVKKSGYEEKHLPMHVNADTGLDISLKPGKKRGTR